MNSIKELLLAIPLIACLASCQTVNTTEAWHKAPTPSNALLDKFVGAEPSPGFIAPNYDVVDQPKTKNGQVMQLLLTTKVVDSTTSKPFDKHDVLSDPAYQVRMRRLSQSKGVDLLSAPSVVTTIGQQAKIEVMREIHFTGEAFNETRLLGTTLNVKPSYLKNGRIHLSGKATLREVDGTEPAFGKNRALSLQTSETYFDLVLKDGQTAQLICRDEDTPGQRIIFVTARLIDPSGKPVR